MLQELIAFAQELQAMYDAGQDLRTISQWTYAQREAGRNIPYMAISQTESVPGSRKNKVIGLWAQPTTKQKELYAFFNEVAPGKRMLNKYTLILYVEEGGVVFDERGEDKGSDKSIINLLELQS